jgi:hypothetical protein
MHGDRDHGESMVAPGIRQPAMLVAKYDSYIACVVYLVVVRICVRIGDNYAIAVLL